MRKDFINEESRLESIKPHVETPLEMLSFDEKRKYLKEYFKEKRGKKYGSEQRKNFEKY